MTIQEWLLVGAFLFSIGFVGWAAMTIGDDDKRARPLPFPEGPSPLKGYTGLHSEDGRTQRLDWPPVGPARREAGTGPATTGLDHWRIRPEAPPLPPVDESGELVRIVWPPKDHQPPAGWNEDAGKDR